MRASTIAREHAEHFWPFEAECGRGYTLDSRIDVTVGVHQDRVLAAKFQNGSLEEVLTGPDLCGALMHVEADLFGASKGDKADLRILDEHASGQIAEPWSRLTTPSGRPASSSSCMSLKAMVGASTDGLMTTVLPLTTAAIVMPQRIASGKFQGAITAPTPSGR